MKAGDNTHTSSEQAAKDVCRADARERPPRPRLVIHIGMPNTGTTTIQSFLTANERALLRRGILYPKAGRQGAWDQPCGHHPVAVHFKERHPYDGWIENQGLATIRRRLLAELPRSTCGTICMSSEAFYFVTKREEMRAFLEEFFDEFTVVVFIRRQDRFIESEYRQWAKEGKIARSCTPAEFLEQNRQRFSRITDYDRMLRGWASVFGEEQVHPVLFEKRSLSEPLPEVFFKTAGLPMAGFADLKPPTEGNHTLNQTAMFLMQTLHHDSYLWGRRHNIMREFLAQYSAQHPDAPAYRSCFSPAQRAEIRDAFRASNEEVARRYFRRDDGTLFEESPENDAAWQEFPGPSVEELADMAASVIEAACGRIASLEGQLRAKFPRCSEGRDRRSGVRAFLQDCAARCVHGRHSAAWRWLARHAIGRKGTPWD